MDLWVVPGDAKTRVGVAEEDEVPEGGDLVEWAAAAGVLEALEAPAAEVLGPSGAPAEYETVASVLTPEELLPWRRWAAPDPERLKAARAFLLAQKEEARRAVREEAEEPPPEPASPACRELLEALAGWRARARPHALPTLREVRNRAEISFVYEPFRFLYRDPRPILKPRPPNRAGVTIHLGAVRQGHLTVFCDVCDQTAYCRHALAAVDRLADWARANQGGEAVERPR